MAVTPSLELVPVLTGMLEIYIHAWNDYVFPLHQSRAQGLSCFRPALGRGRDKKKNNPRKEADTFLQAFGLSHVIFLLFLVIWPWLFKPALERAIHRINHYPADKYLGNQLPYLIQYFT